MAKTKPDITPATPAAKKPAAKVEKKPAEARNFACSCDCPTPLAFNPVVLLAGSEEDAKKRFFGRNGISATDHKLTISDEPEAIAAAEQTLKARKDEADALKKANEAKHGQRPDQTPVDQDKPA